MKFRKDINALRAWAVMAVILFHFGVQPFDGGFVGVDIFFVISGFLMTGILYRALYERGDTPDLKFFLRFYLARSIRIIPVLLALCAVLLVIGWFVMPTVFYEQLSLYAISAVAFVSNMVFWRQSGYFEESAHYNILLHTWSLSIEWQFYLILPVVAVIIWSYLKKKSWLLFFYILGFLVSLGLSIYSLGSYGPAGFYLLPTRAWELLAGGIVFLCFNSNLPKSKLQSYTGSVGFLLILTSILFSTSGDWPGYKALLPIVGTCLVLYAAQQESWWSLGIVGQKLGKWSYSIYLWHWPLAFGLFVLGLKDNLSAIGAAIVLSVVLGALSYRFIELASQQWLKTKPPKAAALIVLTGIVSVIALAGIVYFNSGFSDRKVSKDGADLIFEQKTNSNPRRDECHRPQTEKVPECTYGGDTLGLIMLGDSHAQSLVRTAQKVMNEPTKHVLDWTSSGCKTIFDINDTRNPDSLCSVFIYKAFEKQKAFSSEVPLLVVNRISNVFHGANEDDEPMSKNYLSENNVFGTEGFNQEMQEGIVNTLCTFAEDRAVYAVLPIPEMGVNVPNVMGWSAAFKGEAQEVSISKGAYNERHKLSIEAYRMAASQCGVKLLDPVPYLCDDNKCSGSRDGIPIYNDDDHLSERGAALLEPMFRAIF